MKILKVNPNRPQKKVIEEAVKVLKLGGSLVYPSDTCYALGVDMTNEIAVKKIYKIKGRNFNKPVSVIVRNISQIKKLADIDDKKLKLLKKYYPGPVTFLLLNTNFKIFEFNSVGFRIPDYKLIKMISEKVDFPYASTSANISGMEACYSIDELLKQFDKQKYHPDLVLDGGVLPKNLPSTVVDIVNWPPKIIRQGELKIKEAK